jgi:hypothetical protein
MNLMKSKLQRKSDISSGQVVNEDDVRLKVFTLFTWFQINGLSVYTTVYTLFTFV